MFMTKRKMKEKIMQLNYRVADLEERLCPCEDHEWRQVDSYLLISADGIDYDTMVKYKCRRCGKLKESRG